MRTIARTLVSVLLLVAVSGCSGGNGGGGGDDDDDAASPTPVLPAIGSLSPSKGVPGNSVTLTGSGFGDTQGTSTLRFGAAVATTASTWSDTSIVAVIPDEALPGNRPVTVETAGGTSNAVDFEVRLARAVYVWSDEATPLTVQSFSAAQDGTLAVLDSALTVSAEPLLFTGATNGMTLHAGTRRLYAGGSDVFAAFDIHPRTGALTPAAGSPVTVGTAANVFVPGIAVTPDGSTVYATDYNACDIHRYDAATLTETGTPANTGSAGGGCDAAFLSRSGNWLLQNNPNDFTLSIFAVASDGSLSPAASPTHALANYGHSFTLDPVRDRFYYASIGSGALFVLDLDEATGAVTEDLPQRQTLADANAAAIPEAGTRLFVSQGFPSRVSVFDVDATTGALSPVTGSPFINADFVGGGAAAVSQDGAFLYALHEGASAITGYAVASNGSLTALPGTPWMLAPLNRPSTILTTF